MTDQLAEYERFRNDPWAFLVECCFTLDQADAKQPIKPFPKHFEYLRLYTMIWLKYPLIAVPKSRRMTMSWTHICLILWDVIFHKGRFWAFVSKKEEDAAELLKRVEFVYDHIPPDKIPKELLPKKETHSKPPWINFGELNSKVQGFPQGADQLRQFTFSGIFGDECAFWEDARKFYAASFPTIEGGGRMNLVSSRAPGFFYHICHDTVNQCDETEVIPPPAEKKEAMRGVEIHLNKQNKFLVFDLHYTANPLKQTDEFRESVKASMPVRDFMMEYEKNWETFEGMPVWADFDRSLHVSKETLWPHLGLPLLIGWDFGLTPAAVVCQLRGTQLFVLREYVGENESIDTFAPKVMNQLSVLYPQWNNPKDDFRHYIDPSGFYKKDTDSNTCARTMESSAGIRSIIPGPEKWEARKHAVEQRLIRRTKAGPALVIGEKECPVLVKGFAGGYCYPEKAKDIQGDNLRPLKNRFSHPHDALQYVCDGANKLTTRKTPDIPNPEYGFQKQNEVRSTHGTTDIAGRRIS